LNRQIAFEIRHLLAAVLVGFSVTAAMAQKDTEASGNATTGSPTYYPSPIQPGSEPQSPDPYGNNGLGFQEFGFPAPELNKMDWNARFGPDTCGPFYLPPIPPALGEPRDPNPHPLPLKYPATLGDHVGEIYYMAMGNLLRQKPLSAERQERITQYLATRQSELEKLRKQLTESRDLPTDQTARLLAGLAEEQTPLLQAQEAEAEKIRTELTTTNFFKLYAYDISELNLIRTNDAKKDQAQATARDALSAAYFQNGLSLDQRLLLLEISTESRLEADGTDVAKGHFVFFWPAGARISLSPGLPPPASARFDEFQQLKAGLKGELAKAVLRKQNFLFTGLRTQAYERLAETQAERFRQLDALAEEIRHDFAALPDPDAPPKANLPVDLTNRLDKATARKATLLRELTAHLKEFRRQLPSDRIELVRQDNGVAIKIIQSKELSPESNTEREAIISRFKDANFEMVQQFDAIVKELFNIRTEIELYQASNPKSTSPADIDKLTTSFAQAYATQENWNRQRDYRAAVLQPGLSPAQRRLLFNALQVDAFKQRYQSVP
jgi:hypothetical protein